MRIEQGLQPNHSEYMRLVADFDEESRAQGAYRELLAWLKKLRDRSEMFTTAGFGRGFANEREFQDWKAKEWDPVADEECKLHVQRKPDGSIYVNGDYHLICDDWNWDEDVGTGQSEASIHLQVYTAGFGLDEIEQFLKTRGAQVRIMGDSDGICGTFEDELKALNSKEVSE